MQATVQIVSRTNGLVAARTEHGEYTVFEVLSGDVEVGDIIRGALESLGGETFMNITKGQQVEVFVEDYHNDIDTARRTLRDQ